MKPFLRKTLIAAVLFALPTAAIAEEKVVAKLNGKAITEADMALAEQEIGQDYGQLPDAQKKMALLEYLVDNQLFAEAAEAEKLGSGPDYEARLAYLKRKAMRELYFEKQIKASVSDADIRKIYDDQVKQIKPEEEVQARHILVETEDKAKELVTKIKAGEDFAKLAKENSKDPGSKETGGDLGFFTKGQMVPQFEEAAFNLKKGDVSDPVKTQFGYHILKLEERRFRPPPAFEAVKERILQSMLLRKASETAQGLRAKAQLEYVDESVKKAVDERTKAMEAHTKPAGDKPADGKPADAKPADQKPADAAPKP